MEGSSSIDTAGFVFLCAVTPGPRWTWSPGRLEDEAVETEARFVTQPLLVTGQSSSSSIRVPRRHRYDSTSLLRKDSPAWRKLGSVMMRWEGGKGRW